MRLDRREPFRRHAEVAPGPSAVGLFEARRHQALAFEPLQGDEHGRLRHGPARPLFEREHERHAVGLAALAQHRQEHVQLEVLERLSAHESPPTAYH